MLTVSIYSLRRTLVGCSIYICPELTGFSMAKSLLLLHVLNGLVGSLCIAILGLTTHAIVIKDQVDPLLPGNITSTGMGMLMWAGCGGIVDMLLFLGLISGKSARDHAVNIGTPSTLQDLTKDRRIHPARYTGTLFSSLRLSSYSGLSSFLATPIPRTIPRLLPRIGDVTLVLAATRTHFAMSCVRRGIFSFPFSS